MEESGRSTRGQRDQSGHATNRHSRAPEALRGGPCRPAIGLDLGGVHSRRGCAKDAGSPLFSLLTFLIGTALAPFDRLGGELLNDVAVATHRSAVQRCDSETGDQCRLLHP